MKKPHRYFKPGVRVAWTGFSSRPNVTRFKIGKRQTVYGVGPLTIVRTRKK